MSFTLLSWDSGTFWDIFLASLLILCLDAYVMYVEMVAKLFLLRINSSFKSLVKLEILDLSLLFLERFFDSLKMVDLA